MKIRHPSKFATMAAALALGLASLLGGAAPAVASADRVSVTQTSAAFDDAHELVEQLAADRQIVGYGVSQLRFSLYALERIYVNGGCEIEWVREHYFRNIERFERFASDSRYVLTQFARVELLAIADQLAQLCDISEAQ